MKTLLIIAALCSLAIARGDEALKGSALKARLAEVQKLNPKLKRLTDAKGVVYHFDQITSLDPAAFRVMTSDGIKRVELATLDDDGRNALGYDEVRAKAFAAGDAKNSERAAVDADARRKMGVRTEEIAAIREKMKVTVRQGRRVADVRTLSVTKEGFLGFPTWARPETGEVGAVPAGEISWSFENTEEQPDPIWIEGNWNTVDDEKARFTLYPVGTHAYTNALGGHSTVRAYTTEAKDALELAMKERARE